MSKTGKGRWGAGSGFRGTTPLSATSVVGVNTSCDEGSGDAEQEDGVAKDEAASEAVAASGDGDGGRMGCKSRNEHRRFVALQPVQVGCFSSHFTWRRLHSDHPGVSIVGMVDAKWRLNWLRTSTSVPRFPVRKTHPCSIWHRDGAEETSQIYSGSCVKQEKNGRATL